MSRLRLEDLACPNCGHDKNFHIDVTATATLDATGLFVEDTHYWDENSCCTCLGCTFEANASEFVKTQEVCS